MEVSQDVTEFRGSRLKHCILFCLLAALGVLAFIKRDTFPPSVLLAGVVGVTALVVGWEGITRGVVLRLDREGFHFSSAFTKKSFAWNEADEFAVDAYAIYFSQSEGKDQFIPNLFDASADEIRCSLDLYRSKYGRARTTTVPG